MGRPCGCGCCYDIRQYDVGGNTRWTRLWDRCHNPYGVPRDLTALSDGRLAVVGDLTYRDNVDTRLYDESGRVVWSVKAADYFADVPAVDTVRVEGCSRRADDRIVVWVRILREDGSNAIGAAELLPSDGSLITRIYTGYGAFSLPITRGYSTRQDRVAMIRAGGPYNEPVWNWIDGDSVFLATSLMPDPVPNTLGMRDITFDLSAGWMAFAGSGSLADGYYHGRCPYIPTTGFALDWIIGSGLAAGGLSSLDVDEFGQIAFSDRWNSSLGGPDRLGLMSGADGSLIAAFPTTRQYPLVRVCRSAGNNDLAAIASSGTASLERWNQSGELLWAHAHPDVSLLRPGAICVHEHHGSVSTLYPLHARRADDVSFVEP